MELTAAVVSVNVTTMLESALPNCMTKLALCDSDLCARAFLVASTELWENIVLVPEVEIVFSISVIAIIMIL
jgi:hypothetical protein